MDKMFCSSKVIRKFCKRIQKKKRFHSLHEDQNCSSIDSLKTLEEFIIKTHGINKLDKIILIAIFNLVNNLQFLYDMDDIEKEKNRINNEELIESFKEEIDINIGDDVVYRVFLIKIQKWFDFLMQHFGTEYKMYVVGKDGKQLKKNNIKKISYSSQIGHVTFL